MKKIIVVMTISSLLTISTNALAVGNFQQATEVGKNAKINFKVNGGVINTIKGNKNKLCLIAGGVNQAKIKGSVKINFKVNGAIANTIAGNKNSMNVVLGSVGQGSCN